MAAFLKSAFCLHGILKPPPPSHTEFCTQRPPARAIWPPFMYTPNKTECLVQLEEIWHRPWFPTATIPRAAWLLCWELENIVGTEYPWAAPSMTTGTLFCDSISHSLLYVLSSIYLWCITRSLMSLFLRNIGSKTTFEVFIRIKTMTPRCFWCPS